MFNAYSVFIYLFFLLGGGFVWKFIVLFLNVYLEVLRVIQLLLDWIVVMLLWCVDLYFVIDDTVVQKCSLPPRTQTLHWYYQTFDVFVSKQEYILVNVYFIALFILLIFLWFFIFFYFLRLICFNSNKEVGRWIWK